MIIINNKKYATTEDEQIESLFVCGGTLDILPTEKRKNETLFFTDKEKTRGFFACPKTGVCGQFSTKDNGKRFFQFTCADVVYFENGLKVARS